MVAGNVINAVACSDFPGDLFDLGPGTGVVGERPVGPAVLERVDVSDVRTIVDAGGGRGTGP